MKTTWTCSVAAVTAAVVVLAGPPVARAVILSGTLEATLTHDSGFDDALGNPIARSTHTTTSLWSEGYQNVFLELPEQSLADTQSAGFSRSEALTAVLVRPERDVIVPRFAGLSFVEQSNPAGTASRPASLRLDFSATAMLEPAERTFAAVRFGALVEGFIGDSPGAFTQFHGEQTITARNLEGDVLASVTGSFGGPELLGPDHDVLHGGGRIDRTLEPDGQVDRFGTTNFQIWTPYTPEATRDGPIPAIRLDEGVESLEYTGFFEIQAKNDGSPSGISATEVPEPASLALLSAGSLLLLRQRRLRHRRRAAARPQR